MKFPGHKDKPVTPPKAPAVTEPERIPEKSVPPSHTPAATIHEPGAPLVTPQPTGASPSPLTQAALEPAKEQSVLHKLQLHMQKTIGDALRVSDLDECVKLLTKARGIREAIIELDRVYHRGL